LVWVDPFYNKINSYQVLITFKLNQKTAVTRKDERVSRLLAGYGLSLDWSQGGSMREHQGYIA